jgi:hypothetical protein
MTEPPLTSAEIEAALAYLGPDWQPCARDAVATAKVALLLRALAPLVAGNAGPEDSFRARRIVRGEV